MLSFNEQTHTYYWNGEEVPSVTQILQAVYPTDFSHIPEATLKRAQDRGTFVHQACAFYDQHDLDWKSVDPVCVPYVRAYTFFKQATCFVPESIEQMAYSEVYKYAGTWDRIGRLFGRRILLDIKTGVPSPKDKLQTAGYELLAQENGHPDIIERYNLYLSSDGKFSLSEPYISRNDKAMFVEAVHKYYEQREKEAVE